MPKRTDISSILIIGAGPIIIGPRCEFDCSGTQAVRPPKGLSASPRSTQNPSHCALQLGNRGQLPGLQAKRRAFFCLGASRLTIFQAHRRRDGQKTTCAKPVPSQLLPTSLRFRSAYRRHRGSRSLRGFPQSQSSIAKADFCCQQSSGRLCVSRSASTSRSRHLYRPESQFRRDVILRCTLGNEFFNPILQPNFLAEFDKFGNPVAIVSRCSFGSLLGIGLLDQSSHFVGDTPTVRGCLRLERLGNILPFDFKTDAFHHTNSKTSLSRSSNNIYAKSDCRFSGENASVIMKRNSSSTVHPRKAARRSISAIISSGTSFTTRSPFSSKSLSTRHLHVGNLIELAA